LRPWASSQSWHFSRKPDRNLGILQGSIPEELNLSTSEVIVREGNGKLIIEPYKKKSLLQVLSTLKPLTEDFPDTDEGLLPLDDIEL
jgi:antitoxin VapB